MGKSSINGPFSMAMLVITRGYIFLYRGDAGPPSARTVWIHVTSEASNLRRFKNDDDRRWEVPQWNDGEFSPWKTPWQMHRCSMENQMFS